MQASPSAAVAPQTRPLRFSIGFYAAFVLCSVLIFPIHESAHYLAYRVYGIHVRMTLNPASPADQSERKPLAELAGPVMNLAIAFGAALAYFKFPPHRMWWAALALASSMMRLVIYFLVSVAAIITGSGLRLGNDEPYAAHLWGIPALSLVALLTIPFAVVVWSVVRTFRGSLRSKVLHVMGLGVATLVIGTVVSNVDPVLFPNR